MLQRLHPAIIHMMLQTMPKIYVLVFESMNVRNTCEDLFINSIWSKILLTWTVVRPDIEGLSA